MAFNQIVFNAIHDFAGLSRLLDLMGIFFANLFGYGIVCAIVYVLLQEKDWQKRYRNFFFLVLSALLALGIITQIIQFFFYYPRPFVIMNFVPLSAHAQEASFPSSHATFYFALAFAMYYMDRKRGKYFIAAAALLGIARVFIGVHWPLDILGGALVGWVSVFVIKKLFEIDELKHFLSSSDGSTA